MNSHTAARGVAHSAQANARLGSGDAAIQDEVAYALALLRRPMSAAGVFGLAVALSLVAFLRFGSTPRLWGLVPLLIALAVTIVLDLRAKVIPDIVTLPGIVYALALAAVVGTPALWEAVLGAVAGGGILLLLAVVSRGAFGGGDIKLMAMLGGALGWKGALVVLAFSQVAAALAALGLLIAHRAGRRDPLPVGAVISLLGAVMLLGKP
ncbi:MAG TPA: A24 family peptidase [Candidatus Binatia bacterium]|nr:A24 family peptidase [Candidatus Binatia bacterium]